MKYTTKYNLKKPEPGIDNVDIEIINSNMDIIDEVLPNKANKPVISLKDTIIPNTSVNTIASYTPNTDGNYELQVYLRVINSAVNVIVTVTYRNKTGIQNKSMLYEQGGLFFPCSSGVQTYSVGGYYLIPLYFNAVSGTPIEINVTASIANQVYVSASVTEV
jgi:hypothetical protein